VREALREYLKQLEIKAREERDREGYRKVPPTPEEAQGWESESAWPPCYSVQLRNTGKSIQKVRS
jgi:hypothetical protein